MREYQEHIQYIIDNYSTQLLSRLKEEGREISIEKAMDTLLACDPSQGKKLTDWLVKTYIAKGFRWEDVEVGEESKLAEVLALYRTHFNQIPRDKRNVYLYQSYGELYHLIEPYLIKHSSEETLGSREIRRRKRTKALEESEVLHRSEDMIVAVPLTESAAKWWGRGTKWCTAADKNNYFGNYNRDAPLIVITLLNHAVKHDSADTSSELSLRNNYFSRDSKKFQLWTYGENVQFMDAQDCEVSKGEIAKNWRFFEPIINLMIDRSPELIKFVPKDFITPELASRAVEKDGLVINHIPERLKTSELYHRAVYQNGLTLYSIPDEFITPELCWTAVKNNGNSLRHVPFHMINPEMYKCAIEQDGYSLYLVPEELRTFELCMLALKESSKALTWVPRKFRTLDVCRKAVEKDGMVLVYVPQELIDEELSRIAVEQNGLTINNVPEKYRTSSLYWKAVRNRGEAIKYVPDKYINDKLRIIAIKQDPNVIQHINRAKLTFDLCKLAVESNGLVIRYLPEIYLTPKLCTLAVKQNPIALQFVPEKFLNEELIALSSQKYIAKWDMKILQDIKSGLNEIFTKNTDEEKPVMVYPAF